MNSNALVGDAVLVGAERAAPQWRRTTGVDGLESLSGDWHALTQSLRDTRFYHRHAWTAAYLRHLECDPSAVHFFSFRRSGQPVAIFPLRRAVRTVAGIQLRAWELPAEPHMDLCDALVARSEDSAALFGALSSELSRQPDAWDALYLPNLLEDSVALRAVRAAPLSFVHLVRTGSSMHFSCDSIAAALRKVSPQFTRNLQRQRRKLDRRGIAAVALVRDPGELDGALEDFLRIEASGWKRSAGSAIVLNTRVHAFYRELTHRFGADRRCAINLLQLGGKAIAGQFALIEGRRMNLLKIAYDEAYAAEAPGSRLLHDVLAWCCESDEIDELSLVTGPDWALGRWNPESLDVWNAWIFNATPRGMAAYLAMRAKPLAAAARIRLAQRFMPPAPLDF